MKKTEIRDFVVKQITDETKEDLKKLCKKSAMSLLRGQNKDLLEKFSLKNISNEISSNLPMFWNFLEKCVANPHQGSNKIKQGDALLPQLLSAGAALIHLYNRDMNIFQCINSLIMMKAGCKKSAFNRLNATGTCLSYRSTLDMADKLASGWENPLIQWRSDVELSTSIEEALLRQVETLDETIDILGEPSFRAAILSVELEQVQQSLKDHRRTMHPGYYFIGDNVDLRTQVRQMTMKNQAKDHHMYQMCCYLNRVSGNMLDNNSPIHDVTTIPFSALIPGPADNEKLMENFAFLVAHEWCDNITWLRPFKAALPAYIQHQYMKEMEAKTQRVSSNTVRDENSQSFSIRKICWLTQKWRKSNV